MNNLKDLVIRAAYQAGNTIMEIYSSKDFNVELKGDDSPLTKTDKEMHHVIVEGTDGFSIEKGIEKQLTKKEKSADVVEVVASISHLNQETQDFIDQFDNVEKIAMGSSLKSTVIAEGNADYYPLYAPTMECDTIAAQAVVNSVGYQVIEPNIKKPLVYNKENLLNPYFLVK